VVTVIVLHGYDQAALKRRRAEFATLPEHEAALRLTAADRALEHSGCGPGCSPRHGG